MKAPVSACGSARKTEYRDRSGPSQTAVSRSIFKPAKLLHFQGGVDMLARSSPTLLPSPP
jgi:hypothetical protein